MAVDAKVLVAELKRLRRGRGATAARIVACGWLNQVLDFPEPEEAVAALRSKIDLLGEGPEVGALIYALALDGTGKHGNLTERRKVYAASLGTYGKSLDTVELYENRMIQELADLLWEDVPEVLPLTVEEVEARIFSDIVEKFDR